MKKYCLTKCFKKKLSTGLENTIGTIIVILVVIATVSLFSLIMFGIGYTFQYFGLFIDAKNPIELGIAITFGLTFIGFIIYGTYNFIKYISKGTYNFIIHRIEGEKFECSIFEECKIEPDDKIDEDELSQSIEEEYFNPARYTNEKI